MQIIKRVIEYNYKDKFTLYPLGDIHKGVIHCDEDLLEKTINEIKRDKFALWLGMGDYGDLVVPRDFKRWDGRILAPWMTGHEDHIGATQLDSMAEQFSPIWNKCVGLIEGGHDDDIRKYNNYNFMYELMKRANGVKEPPFIPPQERVWEKVPYGGTQALINLSFHRRNSNEVHDYIIHARHGEGHARTSGARALAVLRLSGTFINAQIVLMGHLHGQESPDIPERLILKGGHIKSFETIACMTGAWLKAYMENVPASYVERWGVSPSTLGCPKIIIEPSKDKMTLLKERTTRAL